MKALHLDGVSAGYGSSIILRDVDLVVPAGKVVALLGANGAGKTTLLSTAVGMTRLFSGGVWLDGRRVDGVPEYARARRGLCMIPEGRAIFRQLTVRENLAMYCGARRVNEAVDRAAAVFPILGDRHNQIAGTLSGGQQQMLALSRALLIDATVILIDEPSMGLAPIIVDEIFEFIQSFASEGRSLLLVEQFATRALGIADYVYILHKGRVAFVGEPEQCEHEEIFEQYVGSVR